MMEGMEKNIPGGPYGQDPNRMPGGSSMPISNDAKAEEFVRAEKAEK